MSIDMGDVGHEEHYRYIEIERYNKLREKFIQQFKNDESEEDKETLKEIKRCDNVIDLYIEECKAYNLKLERWLELWQPCTIDYIISLRHMVNNWKDLKIGFSHKDINLIRCTHPKWEKEFHAYEDFTEIPLIKYSGEESDNVPTAVYDIMRYFAHKDELGNDTEGNESIKSAVSRVNDVLSFLFSIDKSNKAIKGRKDKKNPIKGRIFKTEIDFYFID